MDHFGVLWGLLLASDSDFVATLGSLGGRWEHLRHLGVLLGSLWGYFGISLGSVWVSVGDFVSLDGHFALMVESLWVY